MKKVNWLLVLVVLLITGGCASILPTTSVESRVQDSSGRNTSLIKGIMSEQGANTLIQNTAQADRTMRLGEAQADYIKSQADLNRVMGRVIEKNPDYLWYGFGLGMYGLGTSDQWSEFRQNIYYPEAVIDWGASLAPQSSRRHSK